MSEPASRGPTTRGDPIGCKRPGVAGGTPMFPLPACETECDERDSISERAVLLPRLGPNLFQPLDISRGSLAPLLHDGVNQTQH